MIEKATREELPTDDDPDAEPAVNAINRPNELKFSVTERKLYVPVVTLQTEQQLTTPNSENVPANTDPNFANVHRIWKNIKIIVPLKYISNFFRNLELPLIKTKLYMELNWTKYFVLCYQNQNSIFQITKGELYIPVVTLNTENNNKLSELLSKGFERTMVWNEYKSKIEGVTIPQNDNMFRRTT